MRTRATSNQPAIADPWEPPATLEELAALWDKEDEKYEAWSKAESTKQDMYAQGNFQGRAISYGICAAQLRAALKAGNK